jgi:MinD-like ATPase involved in chromosome partitioning or flagellar assembly
VGEILTVWSQTKKSGKTLLLYNLAKSISKKIPEKNILVLCINMSYGNLLPLFNIGKNEFSLEVAVNYMLSEPDEPLEFKNIIANKDNLYFMGSQNTTVNYASRNIDTYEKLLSELRDSFDLILVDACSGKNNQLTNMVISNSEAILNVLIQDNDLLETEFSTGKEIAYAINMHREIYPKASDIKNKYSIKAPLFEIPLCNTLQEMKNKKMLDFYDQHDTEYSQHVDELANILLDKFHFAIKVEPGKKAKTHKRSLFIW